MNNPAREIEWASLMRAAMAGDSRAYHRLLASLTPYLRAIARRRCDQLGVAKSEAEDIVQEVLLAVHLKRETWDPFRPIGPWISTMVRNKLIDSLRRRGRHIVVPIEDVVAILETDDRVTSSDRIDISSVLSTLEDPQRTIVQRISLDGSSVREIAQQLKMSEVAVRVSLHRALKALASRYKIV